MVTQVGGSATIEKPNYLNYSNKILTTDDNSRETSELEQSKIIQRLQPRLQTQGSTELSTHIKN